MNKIAHYNNIADKGLELIAKISYMNEAARELLTNSSEEHVLKMAQQAKTLEEAISEYRSTLIDSFSALSSGNDNAEITGFESENGIKI